MVSDASKKKAAQKKAAAVAKRGGKAAAASSKSADKVADKLADIQISDRTCTGVLCSHPLSRDIRVSNSNKSISQFIHTTLFDIYLTKINQYKYIMK